MLLGSGNPRPRGRTSRTLRTFACALGVATLAGCASAGGVAHAPTPPSNRVVVHNYSWDRVTLYLASRGLTWRLGELEPYTERTFSVPRGLAADVGDAHLVARRLAGLSFRSESFMFPSGSTAVWTIGTQPATSYVTLR